MNSILKPILLFGAVLILGLASSSAQAGNSAFCQISTDDSGGYYELYEMRVNIISKVVSDRIETDGTPIKGFRISEHDSLSCHICPVRTQDPMSPTNNVRYCLDARVEMCEKIFLAAKNKDLQCSPNISPLLQRKCEDWAKRSEKFHADIVKNNFLESKDPICRQVQDYYSKSIAAKSGQQ